jgi:hypothetical protein
MDEQLLRVRRMVWGGRRPSGQVGTSAKALGEGESEGWPESLAG